MTKEEIHQMEVSACNICLLRADLKTCFYKKHPCKFAHALQEKDNTVSTGSGSKIFATGHLFVNAIRDFDS
jgi:hypothetical protein